MTRRALPVFLAFFIMGFVDSVGAMVGYAREQFHLSGAMAGLLPFFGFAAFALVSVPAGVLVDRIGKVRMLGAGLALVLAGELIPTVSVARYGYLLAAIFFIGIGMTVLQVAGNPIMRDVSEPGKFTRNLTLAQFIKSLGSNAAPYLLPLAAAFGWGWTAVFPIFAACAALNLALLPAIRVAAAPRAEAPATLRGCLALLRDPYVASVVAAIFLYVGAEVGLNAWIATHLQRSFGMDLDTATRALGLFLGGLAAGRLGGSVLLSFVSPQRFLLATAGLGVLATGAMLVPSRAVVLAATLLAGLSFSNIWPLVFSLAIEERPGRAGELSGLMCMAIFGGALLPLVMGRIADGTSVRAAFLVPLACFVYLTGFALRASRRPAPGPA
jgi:fucose permease